MRAEEPPEQVPGYLTAFPPKVNVSYVFPAGLLTHPSSGTFPCGNTVANYLQIAFGFTAAGTVPGFHRIPF